MTQTPQGEMIFLDWPKVGWKTISPGLQYELHPEK